MLDRIATEHVERADVLADEVLERPHRVRLQTPADRVRERQRSVRRVRADAMELREADQQCDNTVDRVGGLEGVARAVHGVSLPVARVGGQSSYPRSPGTSGPLASPLNHSGGAPRKGRFFTIRLVVLISELTESSPRMPRKS